METDTKNNEYLYTELDEEIDNITFKEGKSSASCNVSDIQAIIYGGFSSRFWMARKYINTCGEHDQKTRIPFFSWECLTICMKHRDLNLVIKDELNM